MKSSRRQNVLNHFSGLLLFVFIFLNALSAFAVPGKTTYQAKIVKPDGYPLEASSVNFKFTILDPVGSCVLYSETYSSVNMSSTGGLISFTLGSGVKTYPTSATTFEQVFSNITPSLSCDTGGPASYSPTGTDIRKIVMQFHDGTGWQTLPAMSINAVPYAMYANEATKLNGLQASDFVQLSTVPTCTASEALRYTGASFSCVAVGNSVTSSTVVTALGYTPADGVSVTTLTSNVSSVSSTVFSVSSTVTSLQNSVAASFAAITSSQWTTSGTNIFYSTGNVGIGTTTPVTKLDVSGGVRIGAESTTCVPALAGTLRYNGSNVEYCNGTSWQAFGVSGAGLQSLNGSTSGTQSFATGSGGTAPNIATANGVHTLNIPNASTGSVTAGLISNADYTTFTNKITSSAASIAQVLGYIPADNAASGTYAQKANNLSDLTNVATARTNLGLGTFATANTVDLGSASATGTLAIARLPSFTGDATIATASNTIILSNSGVTAGTYTKVTVDTKGRVTSGSQITSGDVTTALGYTPANSATIVSSQWSTSGTTINYTTGNVGIGTSAPNSKLDVAGQAWFGVTNKLKLQESGDALSLQGTLATDDNQKKSLLLNAWGGSVGIGTSAPGAKLDINAGSATGLNISQTGGGLYTSTAGGIPRLNLGGGSGFGINRQISSEDIFIGEPGDTGTFRVRGSGAIALGVGAASTTMTIQGNGGNVGIGTTAPTAKLHLSAGTSSTAALKFTSGILLTSPQSGTMEYDGTNFYLTDSANTRRAIAANTNPGTYDNVSNINSSSNITMTPTGSVVVSATTASTNSSTGALVVKGGLGVAGDIYASGTIVTSSNIQGVSVTATSGMISPYIAGSVASGGSLTLESTTHASKGNILLAPNGGKVGIGTTSPGQALDVIGNQVLHSSAVGDKLVLNPLAAGSGANIYVTNSADNAYAPLNLQASSFALTNGNVGVGTSTPTNKLDVVGANNSGFRIKQGNQMSIAPASSTSFYNGVVLENGGSSHAFALGYTIGGHFGLNYFDGTSAYSNLWTITNSGNMGIGTTSPGSALSIKSSTANNTTGDGFTNLRLEYAGGYNAGDIGAGVTFAQQYVDPGTDAAAIRVGGIFGVKTQATGNFGGGLAFFRQPAGAANMSEAMRIDQNGNVGIGVTSPAARLDVSGGAIRTFGGIEMPDGNSSDGSKIYSVDPYAYGGKFWIGYSAKGGHAFFIDSDNSGTLSVDNFEIFKTTSATSLFKVQANGNVGIGTTSPSTALEVSGTVKATAFSGPGILLQSINLAAADFVSHTTSVWLDVPNLSSTFTTAVPTTVDIVASGMYRTMNASVGNVRLVINGTEVAGDYIQQAPSTGTHHANTSINWAQTLAAGTHTIKVQWRNENATGSFDQGWNDSGRVLSRRLKIMVYSQ